MPVSVHPIYDRKGKHELFSLSDNVPTSATVPVVCSRSSSPGASSLLQRILRNRDIAVLLLTSMIFKVSFAISPIKFIISWSGIINKVQIDSMAAGFQSTRRSETYAKKGREAGQFSSMTYVNK